LVVATFALWINQIFKNLMLSSQLATIISNMQEMLNRAWLLLGVQKEGFVLSNGKFSE